MKFWPKWAGRIFSVSDKDLPAAIGVQDNWADEAVSVEGSMNLSAFWAGVRITAETVGSLSFEMMERDRSGRKVRVPDHDLQSLFSASPNADQTAVEFWEGRMLGLCTSGNGFAEKVESANGKRLIALNSMPADTQGKRNANGDIEYTFYDRGKQERLPEEKVFHIRGFGDGIMGLSPVEYARQTLSLTIATEKFASQSYSRGLRSKGFFVMPAGKTLNKEQRDDARKTLVEANSGKNAPWAGVLEGGVEFKSVSLSMRDAEMIMNRRFNVEEVCRWIGVPPIIIGHAAEGQTMWGTGVSAVMQAWYTLRLRTYLKRIEQAISKRIFSPEDRARFSVKINYEDLLRGDTVARSAFYTALLNAGVMTINEVRALEGLPPVAGGDVPRMQMQNVPISGAPGQIGHNGGPAIGANE
ncbi:MAG TPA: phage portal protein [Mesorhizobium sp.]|jgi:HK97 family phage portal protein|uniref:phage portal protein n=1 Tax=Mesorhizobium sp. TaxID=1871066 RepID=UPI002DDD1D0F|nr:phage portal protein [Mesorhizobium sp.]HEV2502341.1 phage portal protein [Mesorhizobium sp.]